MDILLRNDLSEVTRLCTAIENFCAEENFSSRICHDLLLVLDELTANIIMHGFSTGVGDAIFVHLERQEGGVFVETKDNAPAFDPLKKRSPNLHASLEDRPIGGLGIHLIRQFAQYMTYRREEDKNIITLFLRE
ncbi:MAG: ATP-binding protein [Holosporales bacterium]|jgi:anti-sigma regulatory factor (Ser/Thr protein kinase)|nr:ATP-binding protein [Holosporales bacterium]